MTNETFSILHNLAISGASLRKLLLKFKGQSQVSFDTIPTSIGRHEKFLEQFIGLGTRISKIQMAITQQGDVGALK